MVKKEKYQKERLEGDDSHSDVTLSADENDCVDDSDVGLMEDANTLKENTNIVPLVSFSMRVHLQITGMMQIQVIILREKKRWLCLQGREIVRELRL